MADQRRFLFLLASTRSDGNSEALARYGAAVLEGAGEVAWLRLADHPLPPFEDLRASASHYPEPEGNAAFLLSKTLWATDLILVTPLYWYALPAQAKLYLDYYSAWLRVPGLDFRARLAGKTLRAIVTSTGEASEAKPLAASLQLVAEYMKMRWLGMVLGRGNRPGDVMQDEQALRAVQEHLSSMQPIEMNAESYV